MNLFGEKIKNPPGVVEIGMGTGVSRLDIELIWDE